MDRRHKDRRLRQQHLLPKGSHPKLEADPNAAFPGPTARPSPWALHRLLDYRPPRPQRTSPRFSGTSDVLVYGVKLGIGKAAQDRALQALRARYPQHAALLNNPAFVAGAKLALPLVGLQLAESLRDARFAARLRDACEGMLLVNTIDVTADVADRLIEMGRLLLNLYGLSGEEAEQAARQLAADLGEPLAGMPHTITQAEDGA